MEPNVDEYAALEIVKLSKVGRESLGQLKLVRDSAP